MTEARTHWFRPALVAAAAASVVAGLGATVTTIGPWYRALIKPDWTPPDPVFGLIWTIVFSLTAISGVFAWCAVSDTRARQALIGVFAFNGALNIAWSLLFFRLQRPDWALIESIFFWASIVAMIIVAGRTSRRAGWLLAPYLLWVSVAVLLNVRVVELNGVFG